MKIVGRRQPVTLFGLTTDCIEGERWLQSWEIDIAPVQVARSNTVPSASEGQLTAQRPGQKPPSRFCRR